LLLDDPFRTRNGPIGVSVDPFLRDAYSQHWNVSISRKVLFDFLLDAGYIGSKGTRLAVTIPDLNRPVNLGDPRDANLRSLDARRPNPAFPYPVMGEKSIGASNFHSFQASAFRSSRSGLELVLAYTWSKCLSGPSDAGNMLPGGSFVSGPQDLYDLRAERAPCAFDIAHRFTGSAIYETRIRGPLPLFKWLFDGWRIAIIPTASTGAPAAISSFLDTTATGLPSRPDILPETRGDLEPSQRSWQRWFNTAAFAPAPFGRFGTSPRTAAVRLPGTRNVDLGFARAFNFTEQRKLEFRAEIFNAARTFNPLPSQLDLNLFSPAFGSIGGGVQGRATRTIQLGLKLSL
jgi:hypothetical protein